MIQIPKVRGESKVLIEACKRRDDLLELYISADDPALVELLANRIQELQTYIDGMRR